MEDYVEVIHKVRDLGIALSDRRAVKRLKLVSASALLCGRRAATASDLWVLRIAPLCPSLTSESRRIHPIKRMRKRG